jgi:LPS export ABC transporter protein LptC
MNLRLRILLLGLLTVTVMGCVQEPKGEQPAPKAAVGEPDQVMTNSEIYLMNGGRRAAAIKSSLLKAYTRVDTTLLYDVEVRFFDSTGVHTSTLTSDSGRVCQKANTMTVIGHVKANTTNNRRLMADSLRWDANKDLVVSEGHVKVFREGSWMSGDGLETDQRLNKVLIRRNLKGSFDEPKD